MKNMLVRLETLQEGVLIVSDIFDPQGRLLARSPVTLDEKLKKLLQSRGVREIFIEDKKDEGRGEDDQSVKLKMSTLKKCLNLLSSEKKDTDLKTIVLNTVEQFYMRNG